MDAQSTSSKQSVPVVLLLAYQSLGVVYGDLTVSPLYVFRSTFSGGLRNHVTEAEIYGVLSLIFWTLTLVPAIKYAVIVLSADDNGEGGTFALYSLLCRHAKLSVILNQQTADAELSTYKVAHPPASTPRGEKVRELLEKYSCLRTGLLVLVLVGTGMVIGDGILTPSVAVMSATTGISVAAPQLHQNVAVLVSCCILVLLFGLQRIGTHRISFLFIANTDNGWYGCSATAASACTISSRIIPHIIRALSPCYIYHYFKVSSRDGWISLGGVLLCITGSEAMYADLGHFSQRSIKVAFTCVMYPSLVLGYLGQAAYLSKNLADVEHGFFNSVPKPLFYPVFISTMLVSAVGSQAIISATFSIVRQCHALEFIPWMKVVHTSKTIYGQIYIPEVNWIMFVLSLSVTIGFQNTIQIGNAYGIAVIVVMLVTTFLTTLVIAIVWERNIIIAGAFLLIFGSLETLYLSSALFKVRQGGWVSLALASVFICIMYIWHYGIIKKYEHDLQNKVSMKCLFTLRPNLGIVRVPGIGLIYTELVTSVPANFSHFATNLPAFHQILVFVCVKPVPVPFVPPHKQYLIGRIGSRDFRMYTCVVRTVYKDTYQNDDTEFEDQLLNNLGNCIEMEDQAPWVQSSNETSLDGRMTMMGTLSGGVAPPMFANTSILASYFDNTHSSKTSTEVTISNIICSRHVSFASPINHSDEDPDVQNELKDLIDAKEVGFAYILGHSRVKGNKSSSWLKTFAINFIYSFLQRNCRDPSIALHIPHMNLIEVGTMYYIYKHAL